MRQKNKVKKENETVSKLLGLRTCALPSKESMQKPVDLAKLREKIS